jgi:hypothetical protein
MACAFGFERRVLDQVTAFDATMMRRTSEVGFNFSNAIDDIILDDDSSSPLLGAQSKT